MKQRTICKTLAVAVIILFIGLAVQPSVAVQTHKNAFKPNNIDEEELTAKINDILQNNKNIPMISNLFNRTIGTLCIFGLTIGLFLLSRVFLAVCWVIYVWANWNNWP